MKIVDRIIQKLPKDSKKLKLLLAGEAAAAVLLAALAIGLAGGSAGGGRSVSPAPASPTPTPGGDPTVNPQSNPQSGQTAVSGNGYAAGSSTNTGKTNTGDHSKTLVWLTTLCTAGIALTKGLLSRLGTQN